MDRNINELIGKTLTSVVNAGDEIIFTCENGDQYKLYHRQDCCESVVLDDINGDLNDLVGSPILIAEENSNEEFEKKWEASFSGDSEWNKRNAEGNYYPESHTWTFYKLATQKGYVDIRWFGSSNGYYSERVDFIKVGEDQQW